MTARYKPGDVIVIVDVANDREVDSFDESPVADELRERHRQSVRSFLGAPLKVVAGWDRFLVVDVVFWGSGPFTTGPMRIVSRMTLDTRDVVLDSPNDEFAAVYFPPPKPGTMTIVGFDPATGTIKQEPSP